MKTVSKSASNASCVLAATLAALELAQQGYAAWREVPWTDLSRGMGNSQDRKSVV